MAWWLWTIKDGFHHLPFPDHRCWKFAPFFDIKQMHQQVQCCVLLGPNFYWTIPLGSGDKPCSRRSHPNLPAKVHTVESFLIPMYFCFVYMVSAKFCHPNMGPCASQKACSNSSRDSTPSWFASIASKSCCICRTGSHWGHSEDHGDKNFQRSFSFCSSIKCENVKWEPNYTSIWP